MLRVSYHGPGLRTIADAVRPPVAGISPSHVWAREGLMRITRWRSTDLQRVAPAAGGGVECKRRARPERLMSSAGRSSATPDSESCVLVLNSGSSSVKFALVEPQIGKQLLAGIGERYALARGAFAGPASWRRCRARMACGRDASGGRRPSAGACGDCRTRRPASARRGSPDGARRRAVCRVGPGG